MADLNDEIARLTVERDALAAMIDRMEQLAGPRTVFNSLNAQDILAAHDARVKAEALREDLSRCDHIHSNPAVALVRTEIRHMIDAIEKESGNG